MRFIGAAIVIFVTTLFICAESYAQAQPASKTGSISPTDASAAGTNPASNEQTKGSAESKPSQMNDAASTETTSTEMTPETVWYAAVGGSIVGPFSSVEIEAQIRAGKIDKFTAVSKTKAVNDWSTAGKVFPNAFQPTTPPEAVNSTAVSSENAATTPAAAVPATQADGSQASQVQFAQGTRDEEVVTGSPRRPRSGRGMRVAGFVLIGLGAANFLGSLLYLIPDVENSVDESYGDGFARSWMIAWMAISGTMLSIGIPLAVVGSIQKKKSRTAHIGAQHPNLTGRIGVSSEGTAGYASLSLTF